MSSIYILNEESSSDKLRTLIHELGHFIHDMYFNFKQFRFSTEGKSYYANKNYIENFAECFVDLVYYRKDNERTRRMMKILNEIV